METFELHDKDVRVVGYSGSSFGLLDLRLAMLAVPFIVKFLILEVKLKAVCYILGIGPGIYLIFIYSMGTATSKKGSYC
jgi:hypothetical protein